MILSRSIGIHQTRYNVRPFVTVKKTSLTSCLCCLVVKACIRDTSFKMIDESGVGNGFYDKGASG